MTRRAYDVRAVREGRDQATLSAGEAAESRDDIRDKHCEAERG